MSLRDIAKKKYEESHLKASDQRFLKAECEMIQEYLAEHMGLDIPVTSNPFEVDGLFSEHAIGVLA